MPEAANIHQRHAAVRAVFALVFLGAVGVLDYLTGKDVAVSLFYLFPICVVAWYFGLWPGMGVALLAGLSWCFNNAIAESPAPGSLAIVWNAAVRLGLFVAFAYLVSKQKTLKAGLEGRVHDRTVALEAVVAEQRCTLQTLLEKEERLRHSEKKWQTLAEASPEAVIIHDADGRIVSANSAAERFFLVPGDGTLIGRCILDFVAPGYQEAAGVAIRRVIESGLVFPSISGRIRRSDGRESDVDISGGFITHEGRPAVQVVYRDITERRRVEDAARQEQERFAIILGATKIGLSIVDESFSVRYVDPVIRKWRGDPAGAKCFEYFHRRSRPCEDCVAMHVFQTHATAVVEQVPADNKNMTIKVTMIPFQDAGGEWLVATTSTDISPQKKAEDEIKAYHERVQSLALELSLAEERERRRLASGLHDEILQLLGIVKIKISLLPEGLRRMDDAAALGEIEGLVDRCTRECQSMMHRLSPPALYYLGLVAGVEWLASDLRELYGLDVRVTAEEGLGAIDERMRIVLFQCARELLVNVAKHAGTDAAQIRIGPNGGGVRVTVRDRGSGFDATLISRGGGGFGLFSIGERVRNLGGRLDIRSAPGKGTTVDIRVPLAVGRAKAEGRAS
jgi:PAS domain S-box-containing protein